MSPNAMICTSYSNHTDCNQFQIKQNTLYWHNTRAKHMPPAQLKWHCLYQYNACCKHTCMLKTHLHAEIISAWPYYCCSSLAACIQVLGLDACVWSSQIRALRCKAMSSPITCCSPPASFSTTLSVLTSGRYSLGCTATAIRKALQINSEG